MTPNPLPAAPPNPAAAPTAPAPTAPSRPPAEAGAAAAAVPSPWAVPAAPEHPAPLLRRAGRRPAPLGQPRPLGPAGGSPAGPAGPGPRRGARDEGAREDARLLGLARQFAAAYLEIEAGRRDARQLQAAGWARMPVQPPPRTGTAPGRVVSMAGSRPVPGRFYAVALVRRGERFGALTIRLAQHGGIWVVDDARCPEHGPKR